MRIPVADRAIVFDVGNVLIHIDFEKVFQHWAGQADRPVDHIRQRFSVDNAYQQHERGEITASQYFSHLRQTLDIGLSDESFTHGWNAVLLDEIAGMFDLLKSLHGNIPLYIFSNTNRTHLGYWLEHYSRLAAMFDRVFVSCDIGYRKPETAAYEFIAHQIGMDPPQILLIDDLAENIQGAKLAGMQALLFQSAADAQSAITRFISDDQRVS